MVIRVRIPLGSPSFRWQIKLSRFLQMSLQVKLRKFLGLKSITQLRRFLITGGISTVISYSIFLFSIHLLGLHYIPANIFAFCISIIFSYNFNKRWSFEAAKQQGSHLRGYLTLYLITLAVGSLILKITVDFLDIIPEIAFVIGLCFTTVINFLGTKFFIFKE